MTAKKLERALNALATPEYQRAMAVLAVKFSGSSLAHIGKAASDVVTKLLEKAPAKTRWSGWLRKGTKSISVKTGREVTTKALGPVFRCLEETRALSGAPVLLYFSDGPDGRPAPDQFGLWLSLVEPGTSFTAARGYLMFGLPLSTLESPETWFALGDELVTRLKAEVAWLSPALWQAPPSLFNAHANAPVDDSSWYVNLFGRHPQVDLPALLSHARFPYDEEEFEPDVLSGVVAPAWTFWLSTKLAKKVKQFPGNKTSTPNFVRLQLGKRVPIEMTEADYTEWRRSWEALKPIHLKCVETNAAVRFHRGRFDAKSHAQLLSQWRRDSTQKYQNEKEKLSLDVELENAKRGPLKGYFAVARKARGHLDSLYWSLLPVLAGACSRGEVTSDEALEWLDHAEEDKAFGASTQVLLHAAAVAVAAGASGRALKLLKVGYDKEKGWKQLPTWQRRLKADKRLKLLRKLPEWKQFF